MTADERNISNLNKYFVYKKLRDVDAEKVSRILMDESQQQLEQNTKQEASLQTSLQRPTIKVTKQKRKITLGKKHSVKVKSTSKVQVSTDIPVQAAPGDIVPSVTIKKRKKRVKKKKKEKSP